MRPRTNPQRAIRAPPARLGREGESAVLLHQAIEDRLGNGGVTDPRMPVIDRQLAGDDGGLAGCPVVDDLRHIAAGLDVGRGHAPVVQRQHIGLGQLDPA
nr:hypothetical protein [Variovorax paradoxus]